MINFQVRQARNSITIWLLLFLSLVIVGCNTIEPTSVPNSDEQGTGITPQISTPDGLVPTIPVPTTIIQPSRTPPAIPTNSQEDTYPTGLSIPLTDLGQQTYLGFTGGLYPGGSNDIPPAHLEAGLEFATNIIPRDLSGNPDPNGKYILMSIGMSNTSNEFCGKQVFDGISCDDLSFIGQARQDPGVNLNHLVLLNGARGGQSSEKWLSSSDLNYKRIRNRILDPQNLSANQVQAIWLKVANPDPIASLPYENADAYIQLAQLGEIVRTLKQVYPNLQQVFLSSRIYAGYNLESKSPEPQAYETGFSVKWLIEAQINQMETGQVDSRVGNLDYRSGVAPWLGWGPYMWADGENPRSDGLTWSPDDFNRDFVHPSDIGREKIGAMLLEFFKNSPLTNCWFVQGACF